MGIDLKMRDEADLCPPHCPSLLCAQFSHPSCGASHPSSQQGGQGGQSGQRSEHQRIAGRLSFALTAPLPPVPLSGKGAGNPTQKKRSNPECPLHCVCQAPGSPRHNSEGARPVPIPGESPSPPETLQCSH